MTAEAGQLGAGAPGTAGARGAPGYSARRTLPLRVEVIRQLRRRRTMVAFLILLVLPWILVGAGIPVDRVGPSRRLEDAFLALIDGQETPRPAEEETS